jgi:proteasome accessory factor B
VRKKNGRVTYIFTENLEKGKCTLDPGPAFLMALCLYPQQRNMLPGQFEIMMKIIFEDLLRKAVDWYRLQKEIEKYVYVSGYVLARPAENLRHIENIFSALRRKKRVKMTYCRAYDGEVTRREVEPYGLLCRHNVWYLVGRCFEKNEQRVFRLDHIKRLEIVENSVASVPSDFSLKEAYGQAWGVWTESEPGKPETVRLRVGKGLAEKFRVTRTVRSFQKRK